MKISNQDIHDLIDQKDLTGASYTAKEKAMLRRYGGADGNENYTPEYVVEFMYQLVCKYGYKKGNVFEPSAGTGKFLEPFVQNQNFKTLTAFEINHYSRRIIEILYPKAQVYSYYFEQAFLKEPRFNRKARKSWLPQFDLVIGNPPYGTHTNKYSAYFKSEKPQVKQIEDFFILKSLELLKKGGLLCFIVPRRFMSTGLSTEALKDKIGKQAILLDAYRLPKVFKNTNTSKDIVLLQKR